MLTQALLLGNVVLLSGLAVMGWRHRSERGATVFALLESAATVWVGLTVAGLMIPPGGSRLRLWGATTAFSLIVVALWFAFILRYTGRDRWLRPRRFGVAALPLLCGALAYTFAPQWPLLAGSLEQSTGAAGTLVFSSIGPVGAALGVYVYLVFVAGLVLVFKTVLESTPAFVGPALAFVLGTLVTVVASVGELAGIPSPGYPLTQATLGVQALLWGYAVFRGQFLQAVPAVARIGERAVFDELDDGILVVGSSGTVTRANPTAREYLGVDPAGRAVEQVLGEIDVPSTDALPARFERGGRVYQVRASEVTDWRQDPVGLTLVVQDVTAITRRQQRLQVLNRIMRHNLRNDMTVVRGCANQISGRVNGDVAEMSSTIARKADGLLAISEKAVEIDRMLESEGDLETVDLAAFVRRHVEPLANRYPSATVIIDAEAGDLRTDSRLLALVLEEVVENALEHAGDAPRVHVEATHGRDCVRIEVSDDGPGIPDLEVEPLQSGRETSLAHATSFGLWLVSWGTTSLGGDVEFSTDDGSTVVLSVPQASGSRIDASGTTGTAATGE